jgi:hypothetical protein
MLELALCEVKVRLHFVDAPRLHTLPLVLWLERFLCTLVHVEVQCEARKPYDQLIHVHAASLGRLDARSVVRKKVLWRSALASTDFGWCFQHQALYSRTELQ